MGQEGLGQGITVTKEQKHVRHVCLFFGRGRLKEEIIKGNPVDSFPQKKRQEEQSHGQNRLEEKVIDRGHAETFKKAVCRPDDEGRKKIEKQGLEIEKGNGQRRAERAQNEKGEGFERAGHRDESRGKGNDEHQESRGGREERGKKGQSRVQSGKESHDGDDLGGSFPCS